MIFFNFIKHRNLRLLKICHIMVGLLLFLSTHAFAEQTDADQALSISAMDAEIDEPNGWARYSGDVELQQGSLFIQCDQLQIFRSNKGVNKIIAEGKPARYSQDLTDPNNPEASDAESIKAHADRLIYQLESRSIELQGNAKIQQGENLFEGHSILYQIDNRKIIARSRNSTFPEERKQRVKIVLPIRQPPP